MNRDEKFRTEMRRFKQIVQWLHNEANKRELAAKQLRSLAARADEIVSTVGKPDEAMKEARDMLARLKKKARLKKAR